MKKSHFYKKYTILKAVNIYKTWFNNNKIQQNLQYKNQMKNMN
jgi:hypothetical protein